MSENLGRVAILHYACPPIVGGVEAVMASHARLFARAGYDVTLVAGRGASGRTRIGPNINTEIEPLLDSKDPRNLSVTASLDRGDIPADFSLLVEEIYQRLKTILQGYDACIIHNVLSMHKNLALTTALGRLSQELTHTRFIAWCHDLAWADPLAAGVLHEGQPWAGLRTRLPGICYVAISEKRQQQMVQLFQPPITAAEIPVVPNGVALNDFLKLGRETRQILEKVELEKAVVSGAMVLLLPARITRRKNIELALQIVAELKKFQPVRLIVTGPPGPHNPLNDVYVQELVSLRTTLGIEQEVIFLMESWQTAAGRPRLVTDETIADLYRYADALLFPSTQEGFGIPILEAGLARLPIFCTRLEPFEAVAGQLPYYFDPTDPPEMIAHLIQDCLQSDPQAQLRRQVVENYTWESIFEKEIEPLVKK